MVSFAVYQFNRMFFKQIMTFPVMLLFFFYAGSQSPGTVISGKIIDPSSGLPVEMVNIHLLLAKDSSQVRSAVSDKKGSFSITQVAPGTYIIRFSFTGFTSRTSGLT